MRILRAGPHPDAPVLAIRNGTGRPDRAMHLVRPDIGPRHRLGGGGERGVDIALVDQGPRLRWIGAECGLDVVKIGQRRRRFPGDLELRRRLDRVFLALGDNADEIADPDHGDQSREYRGPSSHRPRSGWCRQRRQRRRRHRVGAPRGRAACRAPARRAHRQVRRSPWPEDRCAAAIARQCV